MRCQGSWPGTWIWLEVALMFSQSCRFWVKKESFVRLPSWYQMLLLKGQSRNAWRIVWSSLWHWGQLASNCIPLSLRHFLTPMLWCMHFHTKIWILGRTFNLQIQLPFWKFLSLDVVSSLKSQLYFRRVLFHFEGGKNFLWKTSKLTGRNNDTAHSFFITRPLGHPCRFHTPVHLQIFNIIINIIIWN